MVCIIPLYSYKKAGKSVRSMPKSTIYDPLHGSCSKKRLGNRRCKHQGCVDFYLFSLFTPKSPLFPVLFLG